MNLQIFNISIVSFFGEVSNNINDTLRCIPINTLNSASGRI